MTAPLESLAGRAAAILAVDPPALGGIVLRGGAGPARDAWLAAFFALAVPVPSRRMPASIGDGRLLGGLDLAATLAAGRPVAERGLLAEADGGLVIVAMAERLPVQTAAKLAAALDTRLVEVARDGLSLSLPARFGVIALDEGLEPDERPPEALRDRLALALALDGHAGPLALPFDAAGVAAARARLRGVTIDDATIGRLCEACLAFGIDSLRAACLAVAVARSHAALAGRAAVAEEDAAVAAALVLAPRATRLPAPPDEAGADDQPPDPPPDDAPSPLDQPPEGEERSAPESGPPDDIVTEAARAAIPAGLLAALLAGGRIRSRDSGRAGAQQNAATRGRVVGAKAGDPRSGARLDLIETLRAAAPWQALRRAEWKSSAPPPRILVRKPDFRVARYRHRTQTTTIFAVDASGSSAMQRLAEAKGAVRLLLAECYIRRDEVALIAFRRAGAELVLPPTRSLVRAERALAELPGGGGTPLATAIGAAGALAEAVKRKGRTPVLVLMTDGRANVARDGGPGRPRAHEDALAAGRAFALQGASALFIDTSPQAAPQAAAIAAAMRARYVPLPHADARRVGAAVGALLAGEANSR